MADTPPIFCSWRTLWSSVAGLLVTLSLLHGAAVPVIKIVIPHNAPAGFLVANLSSATTHGDNPYLIGHSDGYLPFFTLTKAGLLVTSRNVESLSGLTFDVSVDSVSSYPNSRWTLRISVCSYTLSFPRDVYEGHLGVQQPGQVVKGLEEVYAQVRNEKGLLNPLEPISYVLTTGDKDFEMFRSTINPGYLSIRSIRPLDSASDNEITLVLKASVKECGLEVMARIRVLIDPVLSNSEYEAVIDESMQESEEVLRVRAFYLPDYELRYSIQEPNDHFAIDEDTGVITTKQDGDLQQGFYMFHVLAKGSDGHESQPAHVIISVLPANGDFDPQKFVASSKTEEPHQLMKRAVYTRAITPSVDENTNGDLFLVPNSTVSNNNLYAFTDQLDVTIPSQFMMSMSRGYVALRPGYVLDYEKVKSYKMDVNVTDSNGIPVEIVRVTLEIRDVNDELPVFQNVPAEMIATVDYSALQGTKVYQLLATDADKASRIRYAIISGAQARFVCDPEFGIITTVGDGFPINGQKFSLAVQARDMAATGVQATTQALTIFVGDHEPQFYEKSYYVKLPEKSPNGQVIVSVRAKSFQEQPLTYSLSQSDGNPSPDFRIDSKTGNVTTTRQPTRPFLYNDDPRVFNLQVTATEGSSSGSMRATTTSLTIEITDINDYRPEFSLVQYIQDGVMENATIGTTVLTVSASDYDGPDNGRVTYSVSDGNFSVTSIDNKGYITVNKPLDYDYQPYHRYIFNITATDNGQPPLSSTTKAEIIVKNVNDEPPEFAEPIIRRQLSETAQPGTVVARVKAIDPDGSGVTYSFSNGAQRFDVFTIDTTGNVALDGPLNTSRAMYTLDIVATDDGTCFQCGNYIGKRLQKAVKLIVEVMDTNNNRPEFTDCSLYKPVLMENMPIDTSVIQVSAVDRDTGSNALLSYDIIYGASEDRNFRIDNATGLITSLKVFDREDAKDKNYRLTVKAEDHGANKLQGFCNFEITIGDINDNVPRFSSVSETIPVYRDHEISAPIWTTLRAVDSDAGENATVEYFLTSSNLTGVTVRQSDGFIFLNRNDLPVGTVIKLTVEARDKGRVPPSLPWRSVDLYLVVYERGQVPIWTQLNQHVMVVENIVLNTQISTVRAQTPGESAPITYAITAVNGIPLPYEDTTKAEPFRLAKASADSTETGIYTYTFMDYEDIQNYTMKLEATSSVSRNLRNQTIVLVELVDQNDRAPRFLGTSSNNYYGSVSENEPAPKTVITVSAYDADTVYEFRKITYSIDNSTADAAAFTINPQDGVIVSNRMFDREMKAQYTFDVVATDGAKSDLFGVVGNNTGRATVNIIIADQNDNSPYFKQALYQASVMEDAEIGQVVMTVTAEDLDTIGTLVYDIAGSAFGVRETTGEIYVAEQLDYESDKKSYNLEYVVFDGIHRNVTRVFISVGNINDNAPQFDQGVYTVENVTEEEEPYPNPPGKFLLRVRATDADAENSVIIYELSGDQASDFFSIDKDTGDIRQIKKIDREAPNNQARVWEFNVIARDLKQSGFAIVKVNVKDINDNRPIFDPLSLVGYVSENSPPDTPVMTVLAKDSDNGENATVVYTISVQSPGNNFKMVDSRSGIIFTSNGNLDREAHDRYMIGIVARDSGNPPQSSTATATIYIRDVNDNPPRFEKPAYYVSIPENLADGSTVLTVSATDLDSISRGNLTFSPVGDWKAFAINNIYVTDTGLVVVANSKLLDYENPAYRQFNLTIRVSDGLNTDTAAIGITVVDANDNVPVFASNVSRTVSEGDPPGTSLGQFKATDADSGLNSMITYRVSRESDPYSNINIDQNGYVSIGPNKLDREKWPIDPRTENGIMQATILAIDQGTPAQTGSATLTLTITDVNDNYPQFAQDYHPVVYENQPEGIEVLQFSAIDPDSSDNGPPFYFRFPDENKDFRLTFQQSGDNGRGLGIINTLKTFDREQTKYYTVRVVMADRQQLSGTNTLTVTIGDRNDNDQYPGHKQIQIYNYQGKFNDTFIGNVYAADLDDWDKGDKTFKIIGDSLRYFRLDESNGDLFMITYLPEGVHNMTVEVTDRVRQKTVQSTVSVNAQTIGELPVRNAGSFRLMDINCEEFIERQKVNPNDYVDTTSYKPSGYDRFRALIAQKLATQTDYVDMFTCKDCLDAPKGQKCLDIRYTAHGSPYYQPARLDATFDTSRDSFDTLIKDISPGASVALVPVDLCQQENCEAGCTNKLVITNTPNVINTNATSLVGVDSYIVSECTCKSKTFTNPDDYTCTAVSCYNGGVCTQETNGYQCACPQGFTGPRCQLTKRSFNGQGWAMFPPLAQCHESVTSLEFATLENNGMIFYDGPLRDLRPGEQQDYIALQLENGYPRLFVNHGSGTSDMRLDGKDTNGNLIINNINDGRWHRIDIYRSGKQVTMVLDSCRAPVIIEKADTNQDRRPCEVTMVTPGPNELLNVNQPLQLGGRQTPTNLAFQPGLTQLGFNGCIRNFIQDGQLYDLGIGQSGLQANSQDGCPAEQVNCGGANPYCGANGQCEASLAGQLPSGPAYRCICNPGWRGATCSSQTTVVNFKTDSFIEWKFKDAFFARLDPLVSKIQLRFRTRQSNGVLMYFEGQPTSAEFLMLRINDQMLQFYYNLGVEIQELSLRNVNVSDGFWHLVTVERALANVVLKMDIGEGRLYNATTGGPRSHKVLQLSAQSSAGAKVEYRGSQPVTANDLVDSCMDDPRYNTGWLPVTLAESDQSDAAAINSIRNVDEQCISEACTGVTCNLPFVCVDLWRLAECRCPVGMMAGWNNVTNPPVWTCLPIDECQNLPCVHGQCIDQTPGFKCICESGWQGDICAEKREQEMYTAALAPSAMIVIAVCLFSVLVLVILFVVFSRRKTPDDKFVLQIDPDDEIRENIVEYDEEGAGEEDHDGYDIGALSKPINDLPRERIPKMAEPVRPLRSAPPPGDEPDVGDYIDDRLLDADNDPHAPPYDTVHEYNDEGQGSSAGSLSSLNSSSSDGDQDYNYLNDWGPRFNKLADMYGGDDN